MKIIEEKAQRYNRALTKSREFLAICEKCGTKDIVEFLEDIFPELKMDKESEDERIRKEILDYIDKSTGCKRWVAWLEKQGNTNIFDVPKISIKNAVEVTSRMQYIDDDIKPIAEFIMDYANWDLHKDEWNQPTLTVPLFRVLDALIQKGKPYCECNQNIEKQGEPTNINQSEFDSRLNKLLKQFETLPKEELISSLSFYLNVVQNDGTYKSDEKQGQKVDNNVEPKFKVGDWIVNNDNDCIYQIKSIKDYEYCLWRLNINVEGFLRIANVDNDFHPWDITKDAKKGDVLVHNGCTFIFMGIENGLVQAYEENLLYGKKTCNFGEPDNDNDYSPATEEQRDILCQKMKEAGYEWNAEKKELKEIEDEPNKCEGCNNVKGCIACVDGSEWAHIEEQKPTEWNEGDESNFQGIIDELKANKHHAPDSDLPTYDRFLSWFKSLKERYVWKPSDEQIDALEHFVRSIGESGFASPYDDNTRLLYSLLEQLKKL